MFVSRRLNGRMVIVFGLRFGGLAALWAALIYGLHVFAKMPYLKVPFLPIASIGTAVAFYVGFKNNAAYERFWEGRKIWGAIVNTSRTFSTMVQSYIEPSKAGEADTESIRQELVYRHIAWLNALRLQLRKTSRFFHKPAFTTKRRLERHAEAMRNDWDKEIGPYLSDEEFAAVSDKANPATQILAEQGRRLAALKEAGRLDLFHQLDLMRQVQDLYTHQGKAERIKNTPFPRFYAEYSRVFTKVFVLLLPFGMLDVFAKGSATPTLMSALGPGILMAIASGMVSWVFLVMESIGDASEDPFERSMNDVPMNALCRTIEIDLRQTLGETDLPPKEAPVDDILY